jgi:hypothetical protein
MSQQPVSIPKHTVLKPVEDYYRLRREGIGFIEQMGSHHWTDYNLHDPGITLLEALCYALTDLGYRLGWDIKDLLAPADPSTDTHQAFFTAREVLTVNPWTTDDFRRLLIDLDGVRNAWVFCKDCTCDLHYLAWCFENKLEFGYVIPKGKLDKMAPSSGMQYDYATNTRLAAPKETSPTIKKVTPQGLYEVLLELEADAESGDLNDRKVEKTLQVEKDGKYFPFTLELRFPDQTVLNDADYDDFLISDDLSFGVEATKIVRTKTDLSTISNDDFKKNWRSVFYTTLAVTVSPSGRTILFENIAMRVFCSEGIKNSVTISLLLDQLKDPTSSGFAWQYRSKLKKTLKAVEDAKKTLHAHRNLDEDYCTVQRVNVEDVAVCCDVEVAPDADIERVQAQIWLEIEQYFNPAVQFYALQELLDEGMPVEEIFQGPALENGFIKADELHATGLKTELRVSDLLNLLMDIEGVVTVNNLLLTKYDAEGNTVAGAADLRAPNPNPKQISALWTLAVTPLHQPRLYYHLSRFLFYKNGLPFLPRLDEARDTLLQLRGEAERPKIKNAEKDLFAPKGQYRDPEDYFPVQYSLPMTYGVGLDGLPSHASKLRHAQAKQLKAYLMPFEQILVNALAQVTHTADLFSLDTAVQRSYFIRLLDNPIIQGAGQLFNGLTSTQLYNMIETERGFWGRRNRFLDHLLARFGEQFKEYALLLGNLEGETVALEALASDKIAFLKEYPMISRDRAKAFNYRLNPTDPLNVAGLRPRLERLLGMDAGSPSTRFLIVEHLLLRPKFPGDALLPACPNGDCNTCGDEDPYSFRLTFVMPGWTAPYNTNLEMRHFAERTIRQETPSHLLPKICWVGNRGYQISDCDPILSEITDILEKMPAFAPNTPNAACTCAQDIFNRFYLPFKPFFELKKNRYLSATAWGDLLDSLFKNVPLTNLPCLPLGISAAVEAEIRVKMHAYFTETAVYGFQYLRFETAWLQWLVANEPFDWTEERLHERVEAILEANLQANVLRTPGDLCQCASDILNHYGQQFYDWMKAMIEAGKSWADIKVANLPSTNPLAPCCDGRFAVKAKASIQILLEKRYDTYLEVSYRLSVLLDLLGKLENTYPVATLHDCDDGSDANPVRLNQTGLGSLRMQADEVPATPSLPPPKPIPVDGSKIQPQSGQLPPAKPIKSTKANPTVRLPKKPKG